MLAPLERFWIPFWFPLDFGAGLFPFRRNQDNMKNNEVQEGVLKNMILKCNYDANMGGLEMQKQAFRIIHVTKYEVAEVYEKEPKMRSKRGPKMA